MTAIPEGYTCTEPKRLEDILEAEDYLEEYSFLVPLLEEALPALRLQFGDCPCTLEVSYDPEEPGHHQLVAYVHTSLSPQEALDALKAFDDGWFLGQLTRTQGRLSFNVRFVG